MSEYWKSTPKYWCKHCKTFVRDTKLEKSNHEATPKHQGNLRRFLRDLHRGHEKDEKDKERAKSEIARLNGLVSGGRFRDETSSPSTRHGSASTTSMPKPIVTESQRKAQLTQLAEMGISIPDELRPDMAMAGEWQVTSERIIDPDNRDMKRPNSVALGVRKRGDENGEEEALEARSKSWVSAYKTPAVEEDRDLDVLLENITRKGKAHAVKTESEAKINSSLEPIYQIVKEGLDVIKKESTDSNAFVPDIRVNHVLDTNVVFKKRKGKKIRQK